jgi:hypothetical protein
MSKRFFPKSIQEEEQMCQTYLYYNKEMIKKRALLMLTGEEETRRK